MNDINNSAIIHEDIFDHGSDDEEEWQKEIIELKAFRTGFELDAADAFEVNESYETFNILNVALSCSEFSSPEDKVLLMNRALIYMLRQMKFQVMANLRKNADEQAALFEDLKIINNKWKNNPTPSIVKCGMPYFKLQNGWAQPSNMYCEQHKKLGYASPDLFIRNSFCWSPKDSANLKRLVIASIKETKLVELEKKVSLMSRFGSSKNSFEDTFKQIEKLRRKDGKEIDPEHVDWLRVSCNLGPPFTPTECQIQWQYCVDPKINNSKWTIEEKKMFFALVKELGFQSWDRIANVHGFGRTALQCCIMFHRSIVDTPHQYSNTDNEKLIALYNFFKNQRRPLLKISFFMDCTLTECKTRLKYLKLKVFNNEISFLTPRQIIKKDLKLSFECASSQKREHLSVKHDELNNESTFTSDEDYLLLEAVVNHGTKWDMVTQTLPGRHPMEVKQRYEKLIQFSKDVLRSIDKAASSEKLNLLPAELKADPGYNVWSILQLFWEPPETKIALSLCGLPLGDRMSAATQQLLRMLEFGHRNVFGPRFSIPRTEDMKMKMVKTMAVISQTLNLPFVPCEVIKNLRIHDENTLIINEINRAETVIFHLADCDVPDLSPTFFRSFIPPNLLTLLGTRVLSSARGLLYSQAELPLRTSITSINPCIKSHDRLLPSESKERLKNRIFSIFFLSLCVAKVARNPGHFGKIRVGPSVRPTKKKLSNLKRKRNLKKIAFKRWNKSSEEPVASVPKIKKIYKKRCEPPSPNQAKRARMIRVTKSSGKTVSVDINDTN